MPSTGDDLIAGFPAKRGHFEFESGHHGDMWLDLDGLFADPELTEVAAGALANLLRPIEADVICGPMTGGALLGHVVARLLGVLFAYMERAVIERSPQYSLSAGQRAVVEGRRVAIVDDVNNAGSATGATYRAVVGAGGVPVSIGALLVLGDAIDRLAGEWGIPVLASERRRANLWAAECPLCADGVPLVAPYR